MKIPRIHANQGHGDPSQEELKNFLAAQKVVSTTASTVSKSKKNSKQVDCKNLSMKDFQLIRELGSGSYGIVSLVNLHGELHALKQVNKKKVLEVDKVANVHFEKDVLQAADSPYFPDFHFTFQDKQSLFFVMEYIPHGPLRSFIPKNRGLPTEIIRAYAAQLVVFLEYLHGGLEVCHRDLKPGNIMVGDNLYLKIIDFGDCKALYNCENYSAPFFTGSQKKLQNIQKAKRSNTFVGTPLYVAPEMLDKTQSGAFSDFWALGVILYEMACGKSPFLGRTELVVFDKILRREFEWPASLQDENLKSLIDQLLQLKPELRLGMSGHDALMAHPFFAGINWDRVRRQEEPVPAFDVIYDPNDPTKVISFSLLPSEADNSHQNQSSKTLRCDVASNQPCKAALPSPLATTDTTLKSMKAFQKINTEQLYRKPQRQNTDRNSSTRTQNDFVLDLNPVASRNRPTQTAPAHSIYQHQQKVKQELEVPISQNKTQSTQACSNMDTAHQQQYHPSTKKSKVGNIQHDNKNLQFLEIEPSDTFNGYQVIRRGSVIMRSSLLGTASVRQLLLCGNQTLFILKTPSQLLKSLNEDQIEWLRKERHPFYLESIHLLELDEIDEQEEARARFNFYEDMIESYIYLNKGQFSVSMTSLNNQCFQVQTENSSEIFETRDAVEWVSLLNQITTSCV